MTILKKLVVLLLTFNFRSCILFCLFVASSLFMADELQRAIANIVGYQSNPTY